MADSPYKDSFDLFNPESQKQNVIDSVIAFQEPPKDLSNIVSSTQLLFKPSGLNFPLEGSERLRVKAKFVKESDGSNLTNGRYQLNSAAHAFSRIVRKKNNEEVEVITDPGRMFALNMIRNKSEREIMIDGNQYCFHPWMTETDTSVLTGTTTLKSTFYNGDIINNDEEIYNGNTYNTGTAALTAATGVIIGAGAAAFTAAMVGGYILINGNANYFKITAFTDDTHISIGAGLAAANIAATTYTIYYKSLEYALNSQFAKGSEFGIASEINASDEFWFELPLDQIFGSVRTGLAPPVSNLEYVFTKETLWANAITKRGTGSVNAKLVFVDAVLVIDCLQPRNSIKNEVWNNLTSGKQAKFRYKRWGMTHVDSSSTNANINLGLAGQKICDLFIMPQRTSQLASQDVYHLASGETEDWTSAVVNIGSGGARLPRHENYKGVYQGYKQEFEDFRKACDRMDAEGGCFMNYDRWMIYKPLYFDLSERSEHETISPDESVRLQMQWTGNAVERRYHVFYSWEVEDRYKITDTVSERVSSYDI